MKKKQGFAGQRTIELSHEIIDRFLRDHPSSKYGYFTKVGFFPEAKYQFFEDTEGNQNYILIYCIKGYGVSQINQKIYHISPGDFFIIPKNIPFSYQADELKPWSIFWFYFSGSGIEEIADSFVRSNQSHKGFLAYHEERVKLFNNIYQNLERGYGDENLTFLNMCLLNLVSSFVLITKNQEKAEDKTQSLVNTSIQLMKENCEHNLNLNQIADNVNMSVSHFSLIFKRKTGISPINYYNTIKMQKACDYLKFTDILVKEIAFKLGILDTHYFSRLFTKTIGLSPNEYRRKERKQDVMTQ